MAQAIAATTSAAGNDEAEYKTCMSCGTDRGRVPRLLKCLHSVCEECLRQLVTKTSKTSNISDSVLCFLCQTRTETSAGVDHGCGTLVKNYVLMRQWLRNRLMSSSGTVQHGETSKLLCDECDVAPEDADEVVAVCYDCSSMMCADHVRTHKKTRSSAKHVVCDMRSADAQIGSVASAAEASSETFPSSCPDHGKELCKFFCSECRSAFCERCSTSGQHNGSHCNIVNLDANFVDTCDRGVEELSTGRIKEEMEALQSQLDELCDERERIADHSEHLSAEIADHFEQLKAKALEELEMQEKVLVEEVDSMQWLGYKTVEQVERPLQQALSKMKQAEALATASRSLSSQAERVCTSSSVIAAILEDPRIQPKPAVKSRYDFSCGIDWTSSAKYNPLESSSAADGRLDGSHRVGVLSTPSASVSGEKQTAAPPQSSLATCSSGISGLFLRALDDEPRVEYELSDSDDIVATAVCLLDWSPDKVECNTVTKTVFLGTESENSLVSLENEPLEDCLRKTGWDGRATLTFKLQPRSGIYELVCRQLSVSQRLILPPPPFLFTSAVHHNTMAFNDGYGLRVQDTSQAGAATCASIMSYAESSEWRVAYCTVGATQWASSFGIIRACGEDVHTSIAWRRSRTAALFSEDGDIFYAAHSHSNGRKRTRFDNDMEARDWSNGAILMLAIREVSRSQRSSSYHVEVEVDGYEGGVNIYCLPDTVRPYFWLSPESSFTLLPPY